MMKYTDYGWTILLGGGIYDFDDFYDMILALLTLVPRLTLLSFGGWAL